MAFGPEMAGIIVPVVIFMIPIVAILTKHQQKMAELIHGNQNQNAFAELSYLRAEVAQLKEVVTNQQLALDDMRNRVRTMDQNSDSISNRLNT